MEVYTIRILICNDDGINAPGLHTLGRELARIADVYVAAPSAEQSGASHGLTTTQPLRAHRQSLPGITDNAWAIDGTPADCAKLALEELLGFLPDVVVSGINHGPNLGTDIIYSGTVAGATEGYCSGCCAIAISAAGIRRGVGQANYEYAARLAADICLQMAASDFKPKVFFNINVPGSVPEDIKGIKYTHMGWRWYTEPFIKRVDPRGNDYYWLQGEFDDSKCGTGSDVEACNAGYVSITPLQLDHTDYGMLNELKNTGLFMPDRRHSAAEK